MFKRKTFIIKSTLFLFQIIIFLNPLVLCEPNRSQEKKIKEEVKVVEVEVPVRVFYKGKPVKNLKKDDFKLYVNKKLHNIHGFYVKEKKITGIVETTAEKPAEKLKPRTFVLIYQITDFNDHVKKSLDYLFEKIFRENDRLIVFSDDKGLQHPNIKNKDRIKEEISDVLRRQSSEKRKRLITAAAYIESILGTKDPAVAHLEALLRLGGTTRLTDNQLRDKLTAIDETIIRNLNVFLKKLLDNWIVYKRTYLTTDINRFFFFSKYLENIKTEKWVLSFYQFELFPRMGLNKRIWKQIEYITEMCRQSTNPVRISMGRMIERLLNNIEKEFNVENEFPHEEISKLFYKVNATFYSFFMKTTRETLLQDFSFSSVASSIENSLRSLTKTTGGTTITSNDLVQSLEKVKEREDTYYMLTYTPENQNQKNSPVKVKVKGKKYTVIYDDNVRAQPFTEKYDKLEKKIKTPDISIENFSFEQKKLHFVISNFLQGKINKKKIGKLKVRIKIDNIQGITIFDDIKNLDAVKQTVNVSIPFKELGEGEYEIFIEVTDLLTQKNTNILESIEVTE